MEAFLEIAISGTVNTVGLLSAGKIPFGDTFEVINSVTLLVLFPLCLLFPAFILGFYICKFSRWQDEDFENKYGAVFEGLKKD